MIEGTIRETGTPTLRLVDVLLTRSGDVLIGTAFLKGYIVQLDYQAHTVRIEKVS